MKQILIEYKNSENLQYEMARIAKSSARMSYSFVVFQIYVHSRDEEVVKDIKRMINAFFSNALICGCESYLNIANGSSNDALAIIDCSIFESEKTKSKILLIDDNSPLYDKNVPNSILTNVIKENPWVTSIEIIATKKGATKYLTPDTLLDVGDVKICGGVASNYNDIASDDTFVFDNSDILSKDGVILKLIGGEDYHFECTYVTGWRALGKSMRITKCNDNIIETINDEPALNVYTKYFNITKTDNFTNEAVVFPLLVDKHGVGCLLTPLDTNDKGELIMGAKCRINNKIRIAYGTPGTIVDDMKKYCEVIVQFTPDVIRSYSDYGRLIFLDHNINNEIQILDSIAPTSGFFGSGQYLLFDGYFYLFNYCVVIAASREGEGMDLGVNLDAIQTKYVDNSFMSRLIKYIAVSSQELEDYNIQLQQMAIIDGLTNLYNRKEIQRRIDESIDYCKKDNMNNLFLMMLDIDDFKKVNDTYGHQKGDEVIIKLCEIINNKIKTLKNCSAGRWGGEEFMISLPNIERENVLKLAEEIRKEFEDYTFEKMGHKTVSIGVCKYIDTDTPESLANAVDEALYHVKKTTKNAVYELIERRKPL